MLYQNDGIYRYRAGINWRAMLTLLVVVPINLPGLIHAINPKINIGNYAYFCEYHLTPPFRSTLLLTRFSLQSDRASWLTSFFISAFLYVVLSKIFPPSDSLVDKTIESIDDGAAFNDITLVDPQGWEKDKSLDKSLPDPNEVWGLPHV